MGVYYEANLSLEEVLAFAESHPQRDARGDVSYVFLGGSAVALHEEARGATGERRPISDIDLLAVEQQNAGTDCFDLASYETFRLTPDDLQRHTSALRVRGKEVLVASPELIIGSKAAMRDTPRKKDYDDFLRLGSTLDEDALFELFGKATYIPDVETSRSAWQMLKLLGDCQPAEHPRAQEYLFTCFPKSVNIMHLSPESALPLIGYFSREEKSNYHVNWVVLHGYEKALARLPESTSLAERRLFAEEYFDTALRTGWERFDDLVTNRLLSSLGYDRERPSATLRKVFTEH